MRRKKPPRKVVSLKRRQSRLTGFFLLIFSCYILFLGARSLTKEHVSIYEVTEKKIADDNLVRGIIMRNEKLVSSDQSGYINYYVGDGAKVGAKTKIYSIDQTGQIYKQLSKVSADEIRLTRQNTNDIRSEISVFRDDYDMSHYEETYNLKYNLENTISELTNEQLLDNATDLISDPGSRSSFQFGTAGESGIISYTSDGLESLDMNQIKKETFDDTNDKLKQLRQTDSVDKDTPVYRLVTNESWSVVFPLTKEQFTNIQQEEYITVTLKKIQARLTPPVTTFTMDNGYYARIDLKRYMIQYINNRFIDIEIEMYDEAGLKIPKSSVLQKSFYRLPADYAAVDPRGNSGLIVISYKKDGTPVYKHQAADLIVLQDKKKNTDEKDAASEEETSYCYVAADAFPKGTSIAQGEMKGDKYILDVTEELDGVYCCNKGYCEFRPVEISYKNDEYCIVKNNTVNGLSAYDHIILNPKLIGENDIIS